MAISKYSGKYITLSDEAHDQYEIAEEAVKKLTDLTNKGWHLIEDGCYIREIRSAAFYGGLICTGLTFATGSIIKKMLKKNAKSKKE